MKTGISLYPGLTPMTMSYEAYFQHLKDYGISRIFTSLHIPETNKEALRQDSQDMLTTAKAYDLDIVADVSPNTCDLLGINEINPFVLQDLGITTVRLDFGFNLAKTALFSQVMPIQLNASTIQPAYMEALRRAGANMSHIDSLHNFYPRPYTGLSADFVQRQTALLHDTGISVGAFVAGQTTKRSPLYEGLPTIEDHRTKDVSFASRHLAALGIDSIFISDPQPTDDELQALQELSSVNRDTVLIKARLLSKDWHMRDFLSHIFTARLDEAAYVIRTQESRDLLDGYVVERDDTICRPRQYGDITVDTKDFLRYMGEVEIIRHDLPEDKRTNIVARVVDEDLPLLQYITPGRKFRLLFVRS